MSDLFSVTVIEKGDEWVDLKLIIIHPDQNTFPENRSFGLMLIWEPTFISYEYQGKTVFTHDAFALSQLSPDQILDADYVEKAQDEIVKSVSVLETGCFPESQMGANISSEELCVSLADGEGSPCALIRITVTDSKWIGHLQKGMTWGSTAHQVVWE